MAANDCHHNQVLIVKMIDSQTVGVGTNVDAGRPDAANPRRRSGSGIRKMTEGRSGR